MNCQKYRNYLIKNRCVSKDADPILNDMVEKIKQGNLSQAVAIGTGEIIFSDESSGVRSRYAIKCLTDALLYHKDNELLRKVSLFSLLLFYSITMQLCLI